MLDFLVTTNVPCHSERHRREESPGEGSLPLLGNASATFGSRLPKAASTISHGKSQPLESTPLRVGLHGAARL